MKVDRFTKTVVLLNCLVPVSSSAGTPGQGGLGADPVNFAIRTTGILSLIFLVLSLAVTPASRLTGWGWLGQFRRMLGLYAFFHAALHFLLFFGLDRRANIEDTASEILKRPYLMVGMTRPAADGAAGGNLDEPDDQATGPGALEGPAPAGLRRGERPRSLALLYARQGGRRPPGRIRGHRLGLLFLYRLVAYYRQLRVERPEVPDRPARHCCHAGRSPGPGNCELSRCSTRRPRSARFASRRPTEPRLPFDFLPGQYLNLTLAISTAGKSAGRTRSRRPRAGSSYCELTVKREDRGLASRHLHDAVLAGDLLDVLAPAGRFTFTGTEAGSIVLIAGGVGITPLMAKIRYLTDVSWPGRSTSCSPSRPSGTSSSATSSNALHRRHPNLHVTVTLTREDGADWSGERGRITPRCWHGSSRRSPRRRVHICGPDRDDRPDPQMLRELGVPEDVDPRWNRSCRLAVPPPTG